MTGVVLYRKENATLTCLACRWYCRIPPHFVGLCGVRANVAGRLELLVYGKAAAYHVDPMEKKPLFHFLPGAKIFSLGTFGCNFGCEFCQNWEISQTPKLVKTETIKKFPVSQVLAKIKKFIDGNSASWLPEKIVETCLAQKITAIAFTYSEPTIFAEYAADTMKLAKRHFLRGVFVSSGYESRETLDLLHDYIDAYNIDLKGATDAFYQRFCHTHLAPVLETIMEVVKRKKWLEVTTLLIPEANTSGKDLRFISRFLASLSRDIPWHVTAFYPHYKMADGKATDWEMLKRAWEIGKEAGLHFVYTGNIPDIQTQSTFCPSCSALLIKRKGFTTSVVALDFKKGRCQKCGGDIAGVWT